MADLSRRSIVIGSASAALFAKTAQSQDAPTPSPSAPLTTTPQPEPAKPPQLSISQQLEHVAVLLRTEDAKGNKFTATGFFFTFFRDGDKGLTTIVTNKHVIAGMKKIEIRWTRRKPSGEPDFGSFIDDTLIDLDNRTILHPDNDVDLAIIAVSDKLNMYDSESRPVYAIGLDQSLIAAEADLTNFQPLEEVLIVGFPDGLSDTKNNIPIFRRGVTATPVYMKFDGHRQFMIDAAIYHGSSGSPVFLYNVGAWQTREGQTQLGTRVGLLGVVWGVFERPTEGEVHLVPAPTQFQQKAVSPIPHNLGACVSSYCILDFEPEIAKRGYKPPDGYKMRAQR